MALKLVKADDYAVRAMIHLACLPEGVSGMRGEIAEAQKIPRSFTAKILRSLVQARLLDSSRGVNGGFRLARLASEISLLDIVEAIEGPLGIAPCVPDPRDCDWSCDCPAAPVWSRVQKSVEEILGGATLEDLVSTPRRNGRVAVFEAIDPGRQLIKLESDCVGRPAAPGPSREGHLACKKVLSDPN